ncbi:MAG: helix-turn-helix transcriptional regulator [Coriobacteriia bacterium]|nr:helix-turn-helix transcriptional regulator [Coriobacteriia bacterium]
MRAFALYDSSKRHRKACAWLLFEPATEEFSLEIANWAAPDDLPLGIAAYAAEPPTQDQPRTVPPYLTWPWLQTRIPPADRANVDQVLAAHGLEDYYVPTLLSQTNGRSLDDDYLVEEVPASSYRTASLTEPLQGPEQLGTQLSRARRAAGMTQHQLSEATGIPQPVISAMEKGRRNPTLETMEILAAGCGRTLRISFE